MNEEPEIVAKKWGNEKWLVNNDKLCVKILYILQDMSCSMHYHAIKEELFYILEGKIRLETIDTKNAIINSKIFTVGEYIYLPINTPHRFTAIDGGCKIIECSTTHKDSDSYRVMPWISI